MVVLVLWGFVINEILRCYIVYYRCECVVKDLRDFYWFERFLCVLFFVGFFFWGGLYCFGGLGLIYCIILESVIGMFIWLYYW